MVSAKTTLIITTLLCLESKLKTALNTSQKVIVPTLIQTRSWEKDGQKQYRTEIVADRVQFGPKGGGSTGAAPTSNPQDTDSKAPPLPDYPEEEINPEDIPF
jgi:single-strand DNA-binding protein